MKMMKRFGALTLALVMALSALSGCGKKDAANNLTSGSGSLPDGSSSAGGASQAEPMDLSQVTDPYLAVSGLAGDEVVARLGEAEITADQLLYWLSQNIRSYLSQFGGQMTTLPWDTEMTEGVTFGQYMLDQALDAAVLHCSLRELAGQEGLTPDPSIASGLDADYVDMVLQAEGDETQVTHMFWASMLTKELLTTLNENSDLYNQLREKRFGENSGRYPTDAEVNAYLDEVGRYKAKHILLATIDLDTREPLDEAAIAEKKALADDLLSQLRAAEDPITLFDQLMNDYSEDGGLAANPDGYTFDSTASLVGGFREAALALAEGGLSGVVETDYGYHIMLRLPLADETVAQYRDGFRADALGALVQQWTDEADIVRADALSTLDTVSFFERQMAYQQALSERDAPAGGGAPEEGQPAG